MATARKPSLVKSKTTRSPKRSSSSVKKTGSANAVKKKTASKTPAKSKKKPSGKSSGVKTTRTVKSKAASKKNVGISKNTKAKAVPASRKRRASHAKRKGPAMKNCKGCGHTISRRAAVCPQCHTVDYRVLYRALKWPVIIFGVSIIGTCMQTFL